MNGYAKRFDFDSAQPMQAHELKEPSNFLPWAIGNMAAIDLVLAGAWTCAWIYYGGFTHLVVLFAKYAPAIYMMATHGMV